MQLRWVLDIILQKMVLLENSSGRDNLFRVNLNATTGNVTIPQLITTHLLQDTLTIANGTTLTITSTGRLAII